MAAILGKSSSTQPTPLLKAALTSTPLSSLSSSVTSTTASDAAAPLLPLPSGNLEIDVDSDVDSDVDEDYDA